MDRVKNLVHLERAYKMGYDGKNISVAVMDTGIVKHPDFDRRILFFKDFVKGKLGAYDDNGHGTHVSGIIAGSGRKSRLSNGTCPYAGVAPQAGMIMLKVLDHAGNGNTTSVLEGIDWILKNKDKYGIRILNISVGMLTTAGEKEKMELLAAVEEVWDAGVMVVTAAGNNGPKENTVTVPGISRKVLTVGSMDDRIGTERRSSLVKGYSGMGPTDCCIVKPEILAPGTGIKSCSKDAKGYVIKSGTSMAAPVVAGVLALAFQKNGELTPADIKLRLYESAYPRGTQLQKKCWGVIHADNLLRYEK